VLCGDAVEKLRDQRIEKLVLTNTIPLTPEKYIDGTDVLSVAQILGDAIGRIHQDKSISAIFEGER
jgi:ribose-phosphate pyrophosphokinase